MSGTVREVAVYTPDGTEVTYKTAAGWTVAGVVQYDDGTWGLAESGHSWDSVRKRTITFCNTHHVMAYEVGTIWEATAPIVRQYFGHHRVNITQAFKPGWGWTDTKLNGGRKNIRRLALQGYTDIRFEADGRFPDFPVSELLKSMKVRLRACATVGHANRIATHKISYNYRGREPRETEYVCTKCAESYGRQPVELQNFESAPLAR
jgi:hypothetical protein